MTVRGLVRESPRQVPSLIGQYRRTGLLHMLRVLETARHDAIQKTFQRVRCPIRVLRGAHARIAPQDWCNAMGPTLTLPRGGHVVPITDGELVAQAVRRGGGGCASRPSHLRRLIGAVGFGYLGCDPARSCELPLGRMTVTTRDQDVVDLLLAQHEHIRSLFAAVESATGDARQERFEELRRFLAVHETAEELVTHPIARTAEGGSDVVDARLKEETESKKLLADLDGMSVDEPGFDAGFAGLKSAVLAHAEAEEQQEFPLLRANNDRERLDKMARAIRATEAIAPTHPHPSTGSSLTTNLVAGPLASLLDRTRDAITKVMA